jgi:tripartite-type tricarboxylate transporter receptor subunit TctC
VSVQAPTEVKEHIKAGTLRAIAVFGNERMKDPVFANVPTAKEQGYDIISPLWQGIGGPLNMDPSVVSYLEKGFQDSLKDPSVVKAIEDLGFEVSFMNSADFKAKWMREYEYYKKAFAELGDRLKI